MSTFQIGTDFYHVEPNFENRINNWEDSVYYWWWEYLKSNEQYETYCLEHRGKPKKKLIKLFKDFDDIHSMSFSEWWLEPYEHLFYTNRGAKLFASKNNNAPLMLIPEYDFISINDFKTPWDRIYVSIPLQYLSKQEIKKGLSDIVDTWVIGKPGKRTKRPRVTSYPVLGRPNVLKLKLHLQVYRYRQCHLDLPLYQIAQDLRLFKLAHYLKSEPDVDHKNTMSAVVSRHLKKARALIKNVGFGRFPDYT